MRKAIFFFLVISIFVSQAQNACFSLEDSVVCAPATISVAECTNGGTNIRYDFGVGQGYVVSNTHTYTQPGEYEIKQLISSVGNNVNLISKKIKVIVIPQIEASLKACEGYELSAVVLSDFYPSYSVFFNGFEVLQTLPNEPAKVRFSSVGEQQVRIEAFSGAPSCNQTLALKAQLIEKLEKPNLLSLSQNSVGNWVVTFSKSPFNETVLKIDGESDSIFTVGSETVTMEIPFSGDVGCVQASSFDVCGNLADSERFCVSGLSASARNGFNKLEWNANQSESFEKYVLLKNEVPIREISDRNELQWTDSEVQCGQEYCYRLETIVAGKSVSAHPSCVVATNQEQPLAFENWRISFENGQYRASWNEIESASKVFVIDEQLVKVAEVATSQKEVSLANDKSCFKLAYENVCGVISDTSNLKCKLTLGLNEQALFWINSLQAVSFQLFELIDTEQVLVYSGNDFQIPLSSLDSSRNFSSFQLIATLTDGSIVRSNVVEINRSPFVRFPNVFSPNGDGINDVFLPVYRFLEKYLLVVYDQWGGVIFSSKNPEIGWDGERALANIPYVYVCEYELGDGKSGKTTGVIQILR